MIAPCCAELVAEVEFDQEHAGELGRGGDRPCCGDRAVLVAEPIMLHCVLGPSDAVLAGLVYTSTSELFAILPVLGFVHRRDGSPFRFDVFLPRHVRAEYELSPACAPRSASRCASG